MAKEKNELKCGRLIDAEYIIPVVPADEKGKNLKFDFRNAKRLIRCKDCKHYNSTPINMGYCLGVWGLYVDENGYCYKAEP